MIKINNLSKQYNNGFKALSDIELQIQKGEIFALLGPNGAGKTTLINTICGIVTPTKGSVIVNDHDIMKDYRVTRSLIGLVPQELTTDAFETVWNTVSFSRGLFGKAKDDNYIEELLKDLSLLDKKDNKLMTLSGGMKRRVLIAKALSHEPQVLFLDEPTAGVDVELRKDMWKLVHKLRQKGVTIILTTHYIEEAEQMADRIGVINHGRIILVEEKSKLMKKLGQKKLILDLKNSLSTIPEQLKHYNLNLNAQGDKLEYQYHARENSEEICNLLDDLRDHKIIYSDLQTKQSSLEEIFVDLVRKQ